MLSRAADSIYWANRSVGRAANAARLIDANLHLSLDLPGTQSEQWAPILRTIADGRTVDQSSGVDARERIMAFLAFDTDNPTSILSSFIVARENAKSIRQLITTDMWEQINKAYLAVAAASKNQRILAAPHEFLTEVKIAGHLYEGITDSTMTHGDGWHFGRLGRLIERADMTSRIVDSTYESLLPEDDAMEELVDGTRWSALLRSASAFEMYRQHRGRISPKGVAELLVADREFPRAMHYCVIAADESLRVVTGPRSGASVHATQERMDKLLSGLESFQVGDAVRSSVHDQLAEFQRDLNLLGASIAEAFFTGSGGIDRNVSLVPE